MWRDFSEIENTGFQKEHWSGFWCFSGDLEALWALGFHLFGFMQVYAHWYVSWPPSVLSIESPRSRALGAKGGACPSSLDRIPKAWSTFGMKHGAEGVSKHSRPRGFDRERTTWGSPHQFAGFWKFEKYFLVLKNHASSPSTPDLGDSIENRTDFRNFINIYFSDFRNF